ncbi:MAG TPA: PQQ-dependent sugar dehydrogenase [Candidatus Avacidaminococcus intestinavium]|uniref:PQQ-dependent sugar dehydrogenase n=1 Tax=Candidatus Avacidaminococcus intestinavium TaxID=2840684 RepID=A0A9D1MNT0_9FIRM|nr:PQQ-dependent sugar dehydrogenase [Candidatus Avacidaminococcus intestinavium]
MKKRYHILGALVATTLLGSAFTYAVEAKSKELKIAPPFTGYVVTDGLDAPWDLTYGPDNLLWVTERLGKRITTINPKTGEKNTILTIEEALAAGGHQGVLGMAFEPSFLKPNSQNYLYVLYNYQADVSAPVDDYKKLVRYRFDVKSKKLINPTTILDKLPGGTDHNGGRVVFGPDGMLYISMGEFGNNQFANYTLPIEAQRLPTTAEIAAGDYSAYVGKVLRIAPDGTIPNDNPVLDSVKSHVYTLGHRNPQGLVFVEDKLFSVEHGPSSDDELNLIEAGGNYGWPHIAGFQDNMGYRYANWSQAPNKENLAWDANIPAPGVPVQDETDWLKPANYKDPLKTFFTVRSDYDYHDADQYGGLAYALWPTIGPSSLTYYPENGPIKGFGNSILITTLKNGAVYKVKLNNQKNNVQGDEEKIFKTQNRYRDIVISPDKKTIYIITDNQGSTTTDYNLEPTSVVENPGSILAFKYQPQK